MHHHICHHYPLYLIRSGILTQIKAKSLRLLVLRFIIVNRQVSDLLLVWNRTTVNRKHAAWASSEERIRCETKYTGNITRLTREHAAPGPAPTVALSVSSWRIMSGRQLARRLFANTCSCLPEIRSSNCSSSSNSSIFTIVQAASRDEHAWEPGLRIRRMIKLTRSYCRGQTAPCFVSLNISLSHSRSLKIVAFKSLGTVSYLHSIV